MRGGCVINSSQKTDMSTTLGFTPNAGRLDQRRRQEAVLALRLMGITMVGRDHDD